MKPNRFDHDACLCVAQQHRDELSENELLALNIVAGAYACNDHVSRQQLADAHTILRRFNAL